MRSEDNTFTHFGCIMQHIYFFTLMQKFKSQQHVEAQDEAKTDFHCAKNIFNLNK